MSDHCVAPVAWRRPAAARTLTFDLPLLTAGAACACACAMPAPIDSVERRHSGQRRRTELLTPRRCLHASLGGSLPRPVRHHGLPLKRECVWLAQVRVRRALVPGAPRERRETPAIRGGPVDCHRLLLLHPLVRRHCTDPSGSAWCDRCEACREHRMGKRAVSHGAL